MNKTVIIYIKAGGAFTVPFLTTLCVGIKEFATTAPNHWIVLSVIGAAIASGYVSLTAFLSTAYSDHMDEQAANTPPLVTAQPNKT